jgi:hypothetical protein
MEWLNTIAVFSLIIAALCTLIIIVDLFSHPQHMWIMNLVWPLTGLYAGPLGLWAYFWFGRLSSQEMFMKSKREGGEMPGKKKPFWQSVSVGAMHCGSGCTLGDICAEWLIVLVPFAIFGHKIFGAWLLDYAFAFLFGIAFQFFTIKPMRDLGGPRTQGGIQSGYAIADELAVRHVRLDGDRNVRYLCARAGKSQPGLLVHDADCDALRVSDQLPGQLVVVAQRHKRSHVAIASVKNLLRSL